MSTVPEDQPIRLTPFDLEDAPESAGIYAWYVRPSLGPRDWQPNIVSGADVAPRDMLGALIKYGNVFRPERVDLEGRATYGLRWRGRLEGSELGDLVGAGDESDNSGGRLVRAVLDGVDERQLMLGLLSVATPVFASPAYVGVAQNLRTRLLQHRKDYERAREYVKSNPQDAEKVRDSGKNFGTRAAGSGVTMNQLTVYALPVASIEGADTEKSRRAAEAAEWTLQRIFRPVFGKD